MPVLIFLFFCLCATSVLAEKHCVVDDLQLTVCMQQSPEIIISLSPHVTELMYALGAEDELVGVMQGSDYPVEAREKYVVGNFQSLSIEKIIELQPDLVVAWPAAVGPRVMDRLTSFGITVYYSDPKSIQGIEENLTELGSLMGRSQNALLVQQQMQDELNSLRQTFSHTRLRKAVVLIADKPLMALSDQGLVKEAFDICGAENLFANLPAEAAIVSPEILLRKQPDVILTTFQVSDRVVLLKRLGFPASATSHVVALNPDLLLRQTPRFIQGVQAFCQAVQSSLTTPADNAGQ